MILKFVKVESKIQKYHWHQQIICEIILKDLINFKIKNLFLIQKSSFIKYTWDGKISCL